MSRSIGIDLGTTNSVAAIKRVQVEILKNTEGDYLTPSCVTLKKKKLPPVFSKLAKPEFVVGKDALEWMKQDPENTVQAVKRLMGRSILNTEIVKIIEEKRVSYRIHRHSRGTANKLGIMLGEKEFSPEENLRQNPGEDPFGCRSILRGRSGVCGYYCARLFQRQAEARHPDGRRHGRSKGSQAVA